MRWAPVGIRSGGPPWRSRKRKGNGTMDTTERRPKHIVLCADGTGNQDIKDRGTNVFRLYEAVNLRDHRENRALAPQLAFYSDGVGTSAAFPIRVIGGIFGWGFKENVLTLYRDACRVYQPGDRIYIFGFSRGAYTARALAAMIQSRGLLGAAQADIDEAVEAEWKAFAKGCFTRYATSPTRQQAPVAEPEESKPKVEIEFLGVWDTVGAMGGPIWGLSAVLNFFYPRFFSELTLGKGVRCARHAIAIDDERQAFAPELWREQDSDDDRLQQVWFAGVHSNVGGGYPKQGMALVALDWMMAEAGRKGLRFVKPDLEYIDSRRDVHGKLYDSRAGFGVYYRWRPRDIKALSDQHNVRRIKVHISAIERAAFGSQGYAPLNIPHNCEVVVTGRDLDKSAPRPPLCDEVEKLVGSLGHTPLDSCRKAIAWGRGSYNAFLLLTVAVLFVLSGSTRREWLTARLQWLMQQVPDWTLSGCSCIEVPLQGLLQFGLGVVLLLVVLIPVLLIRVWSGAVDSKLRQAGISHWQRVRGDLQRLFTP